MPQLSRRALTRLAAGAVIARNLPARKPTTGIDAALKQGIATRHIPCVVGMVANSRTTLYQGAFGQRDSLGVPVRTDSIFSIASMTKAIATVAALQMVEQGKLSLDDPAGKYLPALANPQVLDGFAADGTPRLRLAKKAVTLRNLLSHSSGYCYDIWDETAFRYSSAKGIPPGTPQPLMFEPGTRWQYGQGIDWAGRMVEQVSGLNLEQYFQKNICGPLEMPDTSYIVPAAKFDRLVSNWQHSATGDWQQSPRALPDPPKTFGGGGGLYSTVADYTKFLQMILGKGKPQKGPRLLRASTVESMGANQIGASGAGKMKTFRPNLSADVDVQPGHEEKWGLGFLINTTSYDHGRSAGSLAWAGLFNTFYWADPKRNLCAVLMMQFLPFVDPAAIGVLNEFENAVYA